MTEDSQDFSGGEMIRLQSVYALKSARFSILAVLHYVDKGS